MTVMITCRNQPPRIEEVGIRDGSSRFKSTGLKWYSVILNANEAWKVGTVTGLEQVQPRGQEPDGITDLLV